MPTLWVLRCAQDDGEDSRGLMIVIIPMIVVLPRAHVVTLLLFLEARLLRSWRLGAFHDEIGGEEISATHDEPAHGLSRLGVLRQRLVLDRLPDFKALRLTVGGL